jgi:hypothetical protein
MDSFLLMERDFIASYRYLDISLLSACVPRFGMYCHKIENFIVAVQLTDSIGDFLVSKLEYTEMLEKN